MRRTGLALTASLALLAPSAASAADLCVGMPSNCPGGGMAVANLETALDTADNANDLDSIYVGGMQTAPTTAGFVYSNAAGPVEIIGDGTAVLTSQAMSTSTLSVSSLPAGSLLRSLSVRIPASVPNGSSHLQTTADSDGVTVDHDPTQATTMITGVVLNGGADFTDGSVTTPPSQNGNMTSIRAASAGSAIARTTVNGTNAVALQGDGTVDRLTANVTLTGVGVNNGTATVKSSLITVTGNGNGPAGVIAYNNNGPTSLSVSDSTIVYTGSDSASRGLMVNAFSNNVLRPASLTANNVLVSGFGHDRARLAAATPTADLTVTNSRFDESTDQDTAPNGTLSPAAGTLGASNTKVAPGFVGGGDFRLAAGSALIDAGDASTPAGLDLDGSTLLFDGNGDCVARRDIGAYERQSGAQPCPAPPADPVVPAQTSPPATPPATPPARDTRAPVFSVLGLKKRVLSFNLDEGAKLSVQVKKGRKVVKTLNATGKRGANRVKLPRLKKGRYSATVKATDAAGNVSSQRKSFRVR